MKNIYKDITERRQRMAERAQKVAEATEATKASLKAMQSHIDEMNVMAEHIKSDCGEIKEMIDEMHTNVHGLIDEVTL